MRIVIDGKSTEPCSVDVLQQWSQGAQEFG